MPFTFVHTADLHLDAAFRGVLRAPPPVADALLDAALDAFDAVVDLAIERDAAFLLVAGDVCSGSTHSLRAQLQLRGGLERLSEAGVETLIARGPADPPEGWCALRRFPPGVTVFDAEGDRVAAGRRDGPRLATVHGRSFASDADLIAPFARGPEPGPHIGLLHLELGDAREPAIERLRACGLDYWALGGHHRHEVVRASDPCIVQAGTPQGRAPHWGESDAKGAVAVEVAGSAVRSLELVPCDRVRCTEARIELEEGDTGPEACARRFQERLEALRAEHPGRTLVVDAVVEPAGGRLVAPGGEPEALGHVLRLLRREAEGAYPLTWWNRARIHAGARAPDGASGGDFATDLGALRRELETPEGAGAATGKALVPFEDASWERLESEEVDIARHLPPLSLEERLELLALAERDSLELLGEEEEA